MSRPSSIPAPRVSIILPTYRRPESLARTLDGVLAQGAGFEWELIVIDNDDAPGAEPVFRSREEAFGGRARLVRETRRGSAHARNRGIEEVSGVVTAMLDDDVVPAPDWLERITEPILAGRCSGAGGLVVLDPSVERPPWFDELAVGGYLARWDLGHSERALEAKEFILTANCAFDTAKLRATGGFEPTLGPRGKTPLVNDDALLVRKVRELGGSVRWVPGAVVFHELPPTRLNHRYLIKRAYAQGRSDWILDRDTMADRKFGGVRIATSWLGQELGRRRKEGLRRPGVLFHLALDVVRTGGAMREAARQTFQKKG
ncbi:MAG: glycosyltransferase family 2 protein [Actinomycetota bacterium]